MNSYNQMESGMRVDVRYLPDQPDAARLENEHIFIMYEQE
jgi:hypothetical protein